MAGLSRGLPVAKLFTSSMANMMNPSLPCEDPWTHAPPPPTPEARHETSEARTGSVSLETCAGRHWEASETTGLGSGRWGLTSASLGTPPLDAEGSGVPVRAAYPVSGPSSYGSQDITGLADQISGNGIFLGTGLEARLDQSELELQPGYGSMSQALPESTNDIDQLIGLLTPEMCDYLSQLTEPTATGSRSKCFSYIPYSAALEVQGIQTDQPDAEDDIPPVKLCPSADLRCDEGGNDTGGILRSSSVLLLGPQDAPSPKAADPRPRVLSSHENYAESPGIIHALGFHQGTTTQSPPAATETVNYIVDAEVLPAEVDKDESSGHLAALLRPVAPERTPATKGKGRTLRPAGATVQPKLAQPLPSAGAKTTTAKRHRRSKAREKAYERLEPFSDKEKERRRRDAIRAKKCRDKKNKECLILLEKYKAVCAERDHLAYELAQSHQREKALREQLQY